MSVNYNNWVDLTTAIKTMKPVTTFLKDSLFSKEKTITSDVVAFEKETASDGLASVVLKEGPAKLVKKSTKTGKSLSLLTTKEKVNFSVKEFEELKAMSLASSNDKLSVFDEYVLSHMQNLKDRVARRQEQMIAQALSTGKITIAEDDNIYEADFEFTSANKATATSGTKWNGGTTADPLKDILSYQMAIEKRCGANADLVIMGEAAFQNYISSASVLKALDNNNFRAGAATLAGTKTLGGRLIHTLADGTEIYVYSQIYTDYTGTTQSMIDTNSVIVTSREAAKSYFEYVFGTINRFDPKSMDFKIQSSPKMLAEISKSLDGRNGVFQVEHLGLPLIKSADPIMVAKVVI